RGSIALLICFVLSLVFEVLGPGVLVQLGGKEIKLDLYQYSPLEDWCVEMHKHARPEDFEDEAQDEADEQSDAAAESDDLNSQQASEGSPESEPRA
ncbi:MAG: hypothetical protein AAF937_13230, partial [Planctomycetota bacterium]